jgi:hypothetical protein
VTLVRETLGDADKAVLTSQETRHIAELRRHRGELKALSGRGLNKANESVADRLDVILAILPDDNLASGATLNMFFIG